MQSEGGRLSGHFCSVISSCRQAKAVYASAIKLAHDSQTDTSYQPPYLFLSASFAYVKYLEIRFLHVLAT